MRPAKPNAAQVYEEAAKPSNRQSVDKAGRLYRKGKKTSSPGSKLPTHTYYNCRRPHGNKSQTSMHTTSREKPKRHNNYNNYDHYNATGKRRQSSHTDKNKFNSKKGASAINKK